MNRSKRRKLMLLLAADVLSSSSSSSSSESGEDELLALNFPKKKPKPKIQNYLDNVVAKYSDEEFKANFRLTRTTNEKITNLYENSRFYPKTRTHNRCDLTSAAVSILAFLWYAGNKSCIRDVAGRFGIAESTCHLIITNVMDFLLDIAPTVIKFPSTIEEKMELSREFQEISGYPNVLGCIDGSYIPMRTPAHKIKSTYVNRHDMPSITLQAICDHRKLFMDVFTGIPSKIHDARVFKLSFISKKLPNICQRRWHILGDAAYPLKTWLMTPFRDYGNLTVAEKNFNKKFSQTRVKIENSFALLKNRFRQLIRTDFASVERTAKFIISCCVLHNLCILNNDFWSEYGDQNTGAFEENLIEEPALNETDTNEKKSGEEKRRIICQSLLY